MQKNIEILGWKVKDKVTKFTGVVTHVGLDLYGCVQVLVQPNITVCNDGAQKLEGQLWFDISRLEKVGKLRVMNPIPMKGDKIVAGSDLNKPVK